MILGYLFKCAHGRKFIMNLEIVISNRYSGILDDGNILETVVPTVEANSLMNWSLTNITLAGMGSIELNQKLMMNS